MDSARRALDAARAIDGIPVIDATERETSDRAIQPLPWSGGRVIAAGALLAGVAGLAAAALIAVAVLESSRASGWRWAMASALLVPASLGLVLVRLGVIEKGLAARDAETVARHPDQPWYADFRWDPRGTWAASEWGGDVGFVVLCLLVLVMAVPNFLWLTVFDPRVEPKVRLFALLVLVPDFFIYLIGKGLVSMAKRRTRFGRPYLGYDTFPFFLGESFSGRVTAKIFAGEEAVVAILRCLEERRFIQHSGGHRSTITRTFQLYEVRRTLPGPFRGQDVPLAFELPPQPSTDRRASRPRSWQLEIRGRAPAGTVRFSVPVYARPGINPAPQAIAVPTAHIQGTIRV